MNDTVKVILAVIFAVSVVVFIEGLAAAVFFHGHGHDTAISVTCIISFCTMVISEGINMYWDD